MAREVSAAKNVVKNDHLLPFEEDLMRRPPKLQGCQRKGPRVRTS